MKRHFEQKHIEEVAYLRAKDMKIAVISDVLDLPVGTVDNLLKKAEVQGLYRESVKFNCNNQLSAERLKQLQQLDYVEHLQDRLRVKGVDPHDPQKRIFQRIHVFDSGSIDDDPRAIETRLERFSLEAAPCLTELICQSQSVGVAWGATLASAIKSLDAAQLKLTRGKKPIRFIPTCGEPYGSSLRSNSSSFLVAELDALLNGENPNRLSLTGIPAVLPKEFVDAGEDMIIRRFIQRCNAYRLIFGPAEDGEQSLIDSMDTILTSAGSASWHWRMCGVELCEIGGINREFFEKITLGDLGGVLIPKSEYPKPEDEEHIKVINSLWTGITREQYQNIARKGNHHRGVVVLAIGAKKAHLVYTAIRLGLVNHLICDQALAWALAIECGSPTPNQVPRLQH